MRTAIRLLGVALVAAGIVGTAQGTIRIGVVGPMSSMYGQHHFNGAELAAEEINAAGGIQVGEDIFTVELIQVDTNELYSVQDAVSAVERAITISEVDFFVGGFRTEAVMAMTETAVDNEVVFLIAGAAADVLLQGRVDVDYEKYRYLFRVAPVKSSDLARVSLLLLADVIQTFRAELEIEAPKVAVLAEQLEWTEPLVQQAQLLVSSPPPAGLGAEHVGSWRPSARASDVTTELSQVERAGAHIIYTAFSDRVGVPFGRDWGWLQIPAAVVGINVQAQSDAWLVNTGGFGAYAATVGIYARGVAVTPVTIPFVEQYIDRFGELPLYTAATYDALHILATAIEAAGTLDTDSVIAALEQTDHEATIGRIVFDETHDLIWGPEHVTGLGVQWVDGEARAFWPRDWRPDPLQRPEHVLGYPGALPYQIPPWVLTHWQADGK